MQNNTETAETIFLPCLILFLEAKKEKENYEILNESEDVSVCWGESWNMQHVTIPRSVRDVTNKMAVCHSSLKH